MKRVLLSILFCISIAGQFAYGQVKKGKTPVKPASAVKLSPEDYPGLLPQAEEVNKATIAGDWDTIANYTHPKIVAMMGGRKQMIVVIRKMFDKMKSEGFEIVLFENGPVSQMEKVGTEIFALIETRLVMMMPNGRRLASKSSMVGVSGDRGQNWKFISASEPEKFKRVFPAAAVKIKVPPEQPPVFLEN